MNTYLNTFTPNTLFLINLLRITRYLTLLLDYRYQPLIHLLPQYYSKYRQEDFFLYLTFSETSRAMRQPKMRPNVINIHTHY